MSLSYTAEHEWITGEEPATVGITAYAAEALGDIVYVELPEPGTELKAGETCGELESTKSVSELYAPVTGTVVARNEAVVDDPSLINSDPQGAGWLFTVAVTESGELLTEEAYQALISA
ncbi:glycine cleavage system H protein [Longispora fulva]|uniref:Glycine cleavage system H protein n=1 Tax=Longispora fulva TaxID=619741 RepID=A0A8J7KMW7_9ACTN|nr:glycine cleavage system protein GcvH [Longispora fulva]MBG6140974.1 glycine cleavage system H protein [Longispora fulva]GIG60759.1 glycine cleavage system H protein [Longispora fulva]